MATHEQYMQRALELAKLAAQKGEVPVGALIVYKDEIIAEGFNSPIQKNDPTAHAEIIAIRQAAQTLKNYRLVDTTLYVTLEPCAMCFGAIIHARIKQLVFGAWDNKSGAVHSAMRVLEEPALNHRVSWLGGIMKDECSHMLKSFFRAKRKS